MHGTASLLGPKFVFTSGHIDTIFLSLLAVTLAIFPLSQAFAHSGMLLLFYFWSVDDGLVFLSPIINTSIDLLAEACGLHEASAAT